MSQGYLNTRTLIIENTDGQQQLWQRITVVCDLCDPITVDLAGHHIRALHKMCEDLIRLFPDLCGNEPQVRGGPTVN